MKRLVLAAVLVAPVIAGAHPNATGHFTAPQQPWSSSERRVRLLRPAVAQLTKSQAPLGALMSQGWRLDWDGKPDAPGTMAIRLVVPVMPTSGQGQAMEVLQIGWSAAPGAVHTCLTFGLDSGSQKRLPDRTINGVSFAVVSNGDAGMNQSIDATDLRSVVDGRCYAVERFTYAVKAADPDPKVKLTQKQGAAMLDASLASLHLGPGQPLPMPHVVTPANTVAR